MSLKSQELHENENISGDLITCPHCSRTQQQVKAGMNAGNQRYKCLICQRRYTPLPRPRGYSNELREQALLLRSQGMKATQIAKQLGVNPRSVLNWVYKQESESADEPAISDKAEAAVSDATHGRRRATINDVAQEAGVSTATISNYMNGKGRMSTETRSRIKAAMETLHFTPNSLTRAIRQGRTRILGVLTFGTNIPDEDYTSDISSPILRGISEAADKAEHELLLYTGWPHNSIRYSGLNLLNGHVDGLIWVAPALHEPILERIAVAGMPVVALLTRHVPDGVGYINADNIGAMQILVEHLAGMGHKRIAYIGPAQSSNFIDRRNGYRQGLQAVGLPFDPELEASPKQNFWLWAIYEGMLERWLQLPQPPTAIITADDGFAATVIQELQRRGLRIPEDISVTGFNDVVNARFVNGGITTIRQPFRSIGQLGVERLLALVESVSVDECRRTLPAELIVRNTTAPLRSSPV